MASPESGGIFGFLKGVLNKLFAREGERKAVQQVQKREQPKETKEEKRERKDRAEEILQELKRVTPSHPAYEILQGVELLEKKTIADHPELGILLLDIVHTVNTDPNKYHDSRWLQDKLRRLNIFIANLGTSPEASKLQDISQNVERLFRATQKDRLNTDVDEDVRKAKANEEVLEERIATSAQSYNPANLNWDTITDSLPDPYKTDIQTARRALEGATGDDRKDRFQKFSSKIEEHKRKAVIELSKNPTDASKVKAYQELQRAQDKLASDFIKEHPSEGGRLYVATKGGEPGSEVEKLIQADENYRDYWFYHIIENLLYNKKMDPHHQLYQLYESGDMNIFLDIVRRIKDDQGNSIGQNLADRYVVLRNTIFQAHDFDFYCAHPQQDLKEFIGSTALFLNEYIDAALQDPMVSLAKRLYESQLFHIRESHGGYVPREFLQWNEGKLRASKLDEDVEKLLKQAIAAGQLYQIKIDPLKGGLPAPSMWNRKQIDPNRPYTLRDLYGEIETDEGKKMIPAVSEDWRRQLGELKIASALKQAKGLSLVDQRMLEIIGKSKGTGGRYIMDNNDWNAKAFNSVPYEGIVRYIEPIIHYYSRYGLGMDISSAFFNMMVADRGNYNWDPNHMKVLMDYYHNDKYDEAQEYAKKNNLGDIQTRLYAMDNPFGYSGMWGTMTKWRVGDTTAGFDDWEKDQAYAAAVKLTNIGDVFSAPERESYFQKYDRTWAYEKAKRYFIEVENKEFYNQCREQYRSYLLQSEELRFRQMAQRDIEKRNANPQDFDPEFEYHWRTQGEKRYKDLDKAWTKYLEQEKTHGNRPMDKLLELTKKLERAYKARTWVQTVMKAPLIVARELDVDVSKHGEKEISGKPRMGPLRKKIIWELLGIDLDELELLGGRINITPTAIQEAQFDRITDVEGALASLQQAAIRNNKDLTDDDFDEAIRKVSDPETGDAKLKQNFVYAKEYWHMVKKAMLGDRTSGEIYDKLGIKDAKKDLPRGVRFHDIDWDNIWAIDVDGESIRKKDKFIIQELRTDLLNNATIDRNYRHLFSTEDMGWEFLNVGALGSRNPVRRAGDLGSHVQFGQLFEKYLVDHVQRPVGNVEEMVKSLHEMWGALSGDFDYVASDACARIAYTTGMIYKKSDWAWRLPFGIGPIGGLFTETSISQKLHGRDRGVAWGPNDMLYWVQAAGSHILPKGRYSRLTGEEVMPQAEWDRGLLGKRLGGTKFNATYEILNMAVFIATIITIYRAITAKSEEEED